MKRDHIAAPNGPAPSGAYTPVVRIGDWIFISGQGPGDPATGHMPGPSIEEQTVATVRNIEALLEAAGGGLTDIVKVGVFLKDLDQFPAFDRAYRSVMPEPPPARTTVGADVGDILIEADAIAYLTTR